MSSVDYLYWFPSEEDCVLPPEASAESRLAVALVTRDAEFDEDGALVVDRETLPGYYVLSSIGDFVEAEPVCAIERQTGRIDVDDPALEGARMDPVWAGARGVLSFSPDAVAGEPDPDDISDRQFAQQLAIIGTISEEEAVAWAASGDLPAPLEVAISLLPEADQFAARMLLSSATSYRFSHPLAAQLGALLGFNEAARRQLWRDAALL